MTFCHFDRRDYENYEAYRTTTDGERTRSRSTLPWAARTPGAPVTAQFVIEDRALRHNWHHLARIRKALGPW